MIATGVIDVCEPYIHDCMQYWPVLLQFFQLAPIMFRASRGEYSFRTYDDPIYLFSINNLHLLMLACVETQGNPHYFPKLMLRCRL